MKLGTIVFLFICLFADLTLCQTQICGTVNPTNPVNANSLFKRANSVSVPVFFHIILSSNGTGDVLDNQLDQQILVLNEYFGESNYSFHLAGFTKTRNDNWRNLVKLSQNEIDMKNALGIDPTHVLNVYITNTVDILGWTNFPNAYAENSLQHGVVVRTSCLPYGEYTDYNLGRITAHEVGHYLGLYHTFGDSCTKDEDLVDDTPIHYMNEGCPNDNTNTCIDSPGNDPIHNLMNYTNDPCRWDISWGQINRVNSIVGEYRGNLGGTDIYISSSKTINYGDTWKLVKGNFLFSSGCQLIVTGALYVNGNASNNVVLTRSGTSNWGGIQFNSGSSGNIDYARISYAAQGIYILETNSLTISNSEIFNCNGHAIYAYRTNYATQPIITNCVIHDNPNSTGIVMYWSSPDIRNCNVYNNYNGLGIADLSSPRLGHTSVSGNNNIHNNSNVGVYSVRYSNPLLGRNLTPFEAGNNIIASNTFRDIQAVTYCNVYAENNWWGSAPPNTTKIAALDGSTIDYDPYLSNPPSLSVVVANESVEGNTIEKRIVESELNLSTKQELLLSDDKSTDTEIITMISQLNALWREACKTDLKSFKTYLGGLSASKEKKTINAAAKLILAGYEKEKRISMLEDVIRDYDKQPITETALMSKFLYYFNEQKDYKAATGTLSEISQKLPQSSALQEAQQHMALIEISGQLKNNNVLPNNPTQKTNVDNDIIENYPNPFNPSTRISYTLKESGKVSLKVYDVLGKEVTNLAEGFYEAGKHTAAFDGSNLASGIYFYRLVTPNATITKKMILTK